jgi:hypothetical protein
MEAVDALANLHSLVDTVQDLLIQVVARFDEDKFQRAISKLKFLLTKLPSLKAAISENNNSSREERKSLATLEPKVKECARLVKLVREKNSHLVPSSPSFSRHDEERVIDVAPPPASHFDELASREKEEEEEKEEKEEGNSLMFSAK